MSDASRVKRYLAHAVIATAFVLGLPAAVVWALTPAGSLTWSIVSVPVAMLLSVVVAGAGSAIWSRRPGSRDLIFADLMLWGWVRRVRAERRLAEARKVLGAALGGEGADGLTRDDRVQALSSLSGLLEARDAYTHGHTRRVTRHAERIARAMRLPPAEVAQVRTAAALHDVGKINTPRDVLNKPGRLTDDEFAVMRRHPVDGAEMLAGIGDPEITAMVRHHHERLDGGGYPDGLAGEEIPLGARIIAVADTFDAMTSSRSYRGACRHKKALEVLASEAGVQLDREAVGAFLGYYSGRRSVAWSALVTTAPQRLLGMVGTSSQGLGSGAASVSQLLPAIGAAAVLAAAPGSAPGSVGSPAVAELAAARPAYAQRPAGSGSAGAPLRAERERGAGAETERAKQRPPSPERRASRDRRRARAGAPSKTGASGGRAIPPSGDRGSSGQAAPERSGSDAAPGTRAGGPGPLPATDPLPVPAPVPDPTATPVPKVEVPAVELPAVELPPVELPPVKLPALETPRVELPRGVVPELELAG
jgi:putative nucleotidyltransferase with HDIG domain